MILLKLLSSLNRILRPVIVTGKNNKIDIKTRKKSHFIVRVYGNNNKVLIGHKCRLQNSNITLIGDNNTVILDDVVKFDGPVSVRLEGNAALCIGSNSGIRGVDFYGKDGIITIGKSCMFSYGIIIRNYDAHKVLDKNGNVSNKAGNITIGNHVWLCQNSAIIKPVFIEHDSIVGFGAVVTKSCPPYSVLAGVPAVVVKSGINWQNK